MRNRIMPLVIVVGFAVLTATLVPAAGSAAQGSGDAGYDDGYVYAGYEEQPVRVTQINTTRPRSPTRWCVFWPLSLAAVFGDIASLDPEQVRQLARDYLDGPLIAGSYYQIICYRTGELAPYRVRVIEFQPRDPTDGNVTTIENVSEFARELVIAPPPAFTTSPPPDRLVVGFETWLATPGSLDAPPQRAQAGHLWARADPVPIAITYDFGDGTRIRCSGPPPSRPPGIHDDERPACARYTYLDSRSEHGVGSFRVRATVTYDVWVTTSEHAAPYRADTIDGPTTTLDVTVREIQAVIR